MLCVIFLLAGCKKEKLDLGFDNRRNTENREASNARILNFFNYNQVVTLRDSLTGQGSVTIKDSLTNFLVLNPRNPGGDRYPGTSYFPTDGKLGSEWSIPQDLFDARSEVKLQVSLRHYDEGTRDIFFSAKDDHNAPMDYYLTPYIWLDNMPQVIEVPRGVSAPSKADHFKIRVINLGGKVSRLVTGLSGPQEDLSGPVSLTYADGTPVNAKTSNILPASRPTVNDYIELPYGTYQFKVRLDDGRILPGPGEGNSNYVVVDPATSTIPRSVNEGSNLHYIPIKSYQPGGVYTIVVIPQYYEYYVDEFSNTSLLYQHGLDIVTDVEPAANRTYYRIQGANAFNGQPVNFSVAGRKIADQLAYGQGSSYINMVHGKHKVEATDAAGTVLASIEQEMYANQNYTCWLYAEADGKAKMVLVPNDLSGMSYSGAQDDATYSRRQRNFFFNKSFLNLSVGNPYVSFTLDNGQGSVLSSQNLQLGMPKLEAPNVEMGTFQVPFQLMAYRSNPDVVPGSWANDIPVLSHQVFVANKSLYTEAGRIAPIQEPGSYTVALIGNSTANATAATKAKMIIVKHTK